MLGLTNKGHPQIADEPENGVQLQTPEIEEKGNAQPEIVFERVDLLLDFVTKRWREHWVTTDIWDGATLDLLIQRPFFLLVSVDAPVSLRWKRFTNRSDLTGYCLVSWLEWLTFYCRCRERRVNPPPLEEFVLWNDQHLYDRDIGRAYLTDRAQVRLFNSSSSLEELHVALEALNLADEQRLRPNWDQYFMQLAALAAQRSNCMKRRVGCVLVRERRVISTGYNGTPRHLRNCNEGGCKKISASFLPKALG